MLMEGLHFYHEDMHLDMHSEVINFRNLKSKREKDDDECMKVMG